MIHHDASFRDEGGFIFEQNGTLYRHVDLSFRRHYDFLHSSGLYDALTSRGLLIRHQEEDPARFSDLPDINYKVIRPDFIPFISYPYEWSFHQLKDAALTTLEIQSLALEHGMVLKDASAFNIQFVGGRPCLIDTLSFLALDEPVKPWVAYRQFCEHFLVPLALMSYSYAGMNVLYRSYLDGIPLAAGSSLLPVRSFSSLGILLHVHLHASFHRKYSGGSKSAGQSARSVSKLSLIGINEGLSKAVRRLQPSTKKTQWSDYYQDSVKPEYVAAKRTIVEQVIGRLQPKLVWDLGANTGEYSRIFSGKQIDVISADSDPECVDRNYLRTKADGDRHLHPLLLNILDPSPDLGWANRERQSFFHRSTPDLIVAFALLHHLSITQNVPFRNIAELFSARSKHLLVEFLDRDDPRVKLLLSFKTIPHSAYTRTNFERTFSAFFRILQQFPTGEPGRTVYLMESLTGR